MCGRLSLYATSKERVDGTLFILFVVPAFLSLAGFGPEGPDRNLRAAPHPRWP